MAKDQTSASDSSADLEVVTLGGAMQMVTDLVQLIEAKALAQRLAFNALVQELSAVGGPETTFRIQARLDAMQWDPALLVGEGNDIREHVAQELALLIEELDSLVSGPRERGSAGRVSAQLVVSD